MLGRVLVVFDILYIVFKVLTSSFFSDYTGIRFNMTSKITDDTFQKEVLESTVPVLVDFWAEWCQPCQMIAPVIDELAQEYTGKVNFGKLNVDENINVPGNYGVMSIPTLIVFKEGKPFKTLVGVQGKDTLKKAIEEALN